MRNSKYLAPFLFGVTAYLAGLCSSSIRTVKADSPGSPTFQIQAIRGDSGLTVYYPGLNKLFVYQNPFAGLPSWGCAYSIQLSTPGGKITRQPMSE